MNTGNEKDILKTLFQDAAIEQPSEEFSAILMNRIYLEAIAKSKVAYKPLLSPKQIGVLISSILIFMLLIFILANYSTDYSPNSYISYFLNQSVQFFKHLSLKFNPIYSLLSIAIFILLFLENKIRTFLKIK